MAKFRILSLDGGGIKGAFSASVLATLEQESGRRIIHHFDLITGTSTGGIIAIGLGLGRSAATIRDFYRESGPKIFPITGFARRWFLTARQLFRPRRSQQLLLGELERMLRDSHGREERFGESRRPLVIPAYDAVGGRIHLFKTGHHRQFAADYLLRAADVATATAAAPTYFSAYTFQGGASYIDGGLWANCPATVGLAEAMRFFGVPAEEVDILSVGATSVPFSISPRRRRGGVFAWNMGLVDALMYAQVETARAQASLLAGSFHRIDVQTTPGRFSLDDASTVDELIVLGANEARKQDHLRVVCDRFLNGVHASPYHPYYRPQPTKIDLRDRTASSEQYRQRMVVYVVWHPSFGQGQTYAEAIYSHLTCDVAEPAGRGLGIPVYFRSAPAAGRPNDLPADIDFNQAQHVAVVVMIDDAMISRGGNSWKDYLDGFARRAAESQGRHRFFPVQFSQGAFGFVPDIGQINFIRPQEANGLGDPATYVVNSLTHDLCRQLLSQQRIEYGSEGIPSLPDDDRVQIFISHTKTDAEPLAKAIRDHITQRTQLRTFFDANDIPHGERFREQIEHAIRQRRSAFLVVQSDAHGESIWCFKELLLAKTFLRPVLIVDALEHGQAREYPYLGNSPILRPSDDAFLARRELTYPQGERIVGRMLQQVLQHEHFIQHFEDVRQLFGVPATVRPLTSAPEPAIFTALKEQNPTATTFVYPDPPISDDESDLLQPLADGVFTREIRFTTPVLLLATGGLSAISESETLETPLKRRRIGLSIGDSPELPALGMNTNHLVEAMVAFARYLLASGTYLSYGGVPRLPPQSAGKVNFVDVLANLVDSHFRGTIPQDRRITIHLARPYWRTADQSFRATWNALFAFDDVDAPSPELVLDRPPSWNSPAEERYSAARSLTAMRQRIASLVDAQILLGGKLGGQPEGQDAYAGRYPGVAEEAYLALSTHNKPVYLIGGFGGATLAVINALNGRRPAALTDEFQSRNPAYTELVRTFRERGKSDQAAERISYDELLTFFESVSAEDLAHRNGLTVEEQRRLYTTPHLVEIIYLVLKGLANSPALQS